MAGKFDSGSTNDDEVRMVMVGKTGTGKSATGNTILGRECFESKFSPKSMTVECSKGKNTVDGHRVAVIDTPSLFDTSGDEEKTQENICQCISYASPGPHIFLVVVRLGRFTEEEKQTVQKIKKIFGDDADKYSMVLFTHGDQLEGTSIKEFLKESPALQELVARCNGQYHAFNNKLKERSQVTELIQKIREIVQKNGGSHYTNEMFQEAERAIEEEKQRILREKEEEIQKEKEKMEREIQERYEKEMQKEMQKYNEQLWAERRRAIEEEKQRTLRETEEEIRKETEKMEREISEIYEKEKQKYNKQLQPERERAIEEKKQRILRETEEEMRKKKEKMEREISERYEKEMQKYNKQLQPETEREMKEREEEREKLKQKCEREVDKETGKIQSRYENEARDAAEEYNPLYEVGGVKTM